MAAKMNFRIKANADWIQYWQVKNGGQPLNIADYTFELEVKRTRGSSIANRFVNLEVGNGITIVDAGLGKISLTIGPKPEIVKNETYVYDFVAIKDGKRYVWIEGQMVFEPGVSYSV